MIKAFRLELAEVKTSGKEGSYCNPKRKTRPRCLFEKPTSTTGAPGNLNL